MEKKIGVPFVRNGETWITRVSQVIESCAQCDANDGEEGCTYVDGVCAWSERTDQKRVFFEKIGDGTEYNTLNMTSRTITDVMGGVSSVEQGAVYKVVGQNLSIMYSMGVWFYLSGEDFVSATPTNLPLHIEKV